jgi:parallel beta-helix repeat protein
MSLNIHVIECTSGPTAAPDFVGQHWVNTTSGQHFLSVGTSTVADWLEVGVGETNTASNVGVGGVAVFKQKSGVDFQFKTINAGSGKVTITNDAVNNEVDIDVVEGNISHDNLAGFVANEHIDWSVPGVWMVDPSNYTDNDTVYTHPNHSGEVTSVGDGAQTVDKTVITNKPVITPVSGDYFLFSDTSDSGNLKKANADSLLGGGGQTLYDAIVATSGGDYTSVKAAFDGGAKTVFVKDGTYIETGDINIPSKGMLMGETSGAVYIHFNNAAYSIICDGSGGTQETAGTISVSNDDATVTGSGTTFTNISPGDYIRIKNQYYAVGSITNNTSLELTYTYKGPSESGITYDAQTMEAGVEVENLIVMNTSANGIFFRAVLHATIKDCLFLTCGNASNDAVRISDCNKIFLNGVIVEDAKRNAISLDGTSRAIMLTECQVSSSDNHGIYINDAEDVTIDSCIGTQNDNAGITCEGSSEHIIINDCRFARNNGKGINTESTSAEVSIDGTYSGHNGSHGIDFDGHQNIMSSCIIHDNGGDGIIAGNDGVITSNHIANNSNNGINMGGGDDNCTVTGNHIDSNSYYGIYLQSDDCTITGNVIHNNGNDGIRVEGDDNIISSNRSSDNNQSGLEITSSANDTIVIGNNFQNNTGTNYVNNGTNTTATANKS